MNSQFSNSQYVSVRREFVLKADGVRPLLYSLDYINTHLYFLSPIEGLALALLRGDRTLADVRRRFDAIFPGNAPETLLQLLSAVDLRVRAAPSQTGIGIDGVFQLSETPQPEYQAVDPRPFIISSVEYEARARDKRRAYRLETPVNIYTIFTHRCTANCLYCYADRRPCPEMPLARWREIIREMADLGIVLASPDNGDVFARQDGVDLLECLLEHGMHFLLSTKAAVSRDQVRRLVEAGFTTKVRGVIQRQVQLSIDAADQELARRLMNTSPQRTAQDSETLENFLAFGIMPKVKAVITGLNADQPRKIVDKFYPRGARVFHFVRYTRSFHRHRDDLFVSSSQLSSLSRQFDEIRQDYPGVTVVENLSPGVAKPIELSAEMRGQLWRNRIGCGGGWSALGIAPDGKAFLCEQMKMSEPFFVGDIQHQSIREIWNSEKLLRFIFPERHDFHGAICERCEEFEDCVWARGRCYRDAYFAYGSIYQPPPLCPHNAQPGLRLS